jgi:hypothetical protein
MIPVNILHLPFELMLFCSVALIGLTIVTQAENLGRLIARRMLRAERRNTAASGDQQTGERCATIADDKPPVPFHPDYPRTDQSKSQPSVPSKEAPSHA